MSAYQTVQIPQRLYSLAAQQAGLEKRSVEEWVRHAIQRRLAPSVPVETDLPSDLQAELNAMAYLSDGSLWSLARATMSTREQKRLDILGEQASMRSLTADEIAERERLLHEYDIAMLRRAHAAMLLQSRGFDLSSKKTAYTLVASHQLVVQQLMRFI